MADAADVSRAAVLIVDGMAYAGWKTIDISLGMDHCSGQFNLAVSERWPGNAVAWPINAAASCVLKLGDEPVITGYVDEPSISFDAKQHDMAVSGRDKTADLVDCSAINVPGQWHGQKIEKIAAAIAAPFSINVTAAVDTGAPLTTFSLQQGETAFDAIDRAARIRALLVNTDGRGNLVLTRAGTQTIRTAVVEGENMKAGNARYNVRDRFSTYIFKGQTSALAWSTSSGASAQPGVSASQVKAQVDDPGMSRYRPLICTNDQPDVAATLKQRAQWEANVRAARSVEVDVTVVGWAHADGLWAVNRLVAVKSPTMRIDDQMLIKSVHFSLSDAGALTTLTLTKKDAFTLLPLKPQGASPLAFSEPAKGATK
jgi:prophage tail gpP-like protein